ncbi:MAG: hypothetical protein ACRC62_15075, partial [Microcoleus sp.]
GDDCNRNFVHLIFGVFCAAIDLFDSQEIGIIYPISDCFTLGLRDRHDSNRARSLLPDIVL